MASDNSLKDFLKKKYIICESYLETLTGCLEH